MCKQRTATAANNSIWWSNRELLLIQNDCLQSLHNAAIVCLSAALAWFVFHVDRISLWRLNDNKKKRMFLPLFFFFPNCSVYTVYASVKAICAPQLNPPTACSALDVELDGERGNPRGALYRLSVYSCHLPQQSSHRSFSELKRPRTGTQSCFRSESLIGENTFFQERRKMITQEKK